MTTLRHYMDSHGITVTIVSGPAVMTDESNWQHCRFILALRNAELGTQMTIPWLQGLTRTQDSDEMSEEVMCFLVSEVWALLGTHGFEDWAGEQGRDADAANVKAMYEGLTKMARDFLAFIGGVAELTKLVFEYERL